MKKQCARCKEWKELSEFNKEKRMNDELTLRCRMCINIVRKSYERTISGVIKVIYHDQKRRSCLMGYSLPTYNRLELQDWCFSQSLFYELYNRWVKSGYQKDLKPSIDRIDDYKSYSFNNIQLMTWRENREKGYRDRKNGVNNKTNKAVLQFDLEGNFIKEYHSLSQAARENKISRSSIIGNCCGKYNFAKGFIWKYKDYRHEK